MTRIGKITWFWATANKAIYEDFFKIKDADKHFVRLEDVDQNYNTYEKLYSKFKFKNKLSRNQFYNVINKLQIKALQTNIDTKIGVIWKKKNSII